MRSVQIRCRGNIIFWFLRLQSLRRFWIFSGPLQLHSRLRFLIVWQPLQRPLESWSVRPRFWIFSVHFLLHICRLQSQLGLLIFWGRLQFLILRRQVQQQVWIFWGHFQWRLFQQQLRLILWIFWEHFQWRFKLRFWIVWGRIRWRFWRQRFQLPISTCEESFQLQDWRGNYIRKKAYE